ncbi:MULTISPECIES: hypothetical protein [unclassified Bradyrhizobium]|uniref:glutamine amidotransferase-related protein n=1 Tax=unclassified Bradyrhizobium TaxID=2631580 RepID=UPI002811F141|nr:MULTISPECIES: hypothetical protein [unclassified Bradyrhizobium]
MNLRRIPSWNIWCILIVIVDSCVSSVFNVVRYFNKLGEATEVIPNDVATVRDLAGFTPRAIVISTSPRAPAEAGISMPVIRELSGRVPVLGICLGHQCWKRLRRSRGACKPPHARSLLGRNA